MIVNELRIGNYIQIGGIITQVEGLSTWDNLIQNSNFAERPLNEFEPIPITEEWLVKFGFYGDDKKVYLCLNATAFRIRYVRNEITLFQYGNYVTIPEIIHVHQLQNIYYFLTNEELIIEL